MGEPDLYENLLVVPRSPQSLRECLMFVGDQDHAVVNPRNQTKPNTTPPARHTCMPPRNRALFTMVRGHLKAKQALVTKLKAKQALVTKSIGSGAHPDSQLIDNFDQNLMRCKAQRGDSEA